MELIMCFRAIRHLGLRNFLREVSNLPNLPQERQLVEAEYCELSKKYDTVKLELENSRQANLATEAKLKEAKEELAKWEQEFHHRIANSFYPPNAQRILDQCNTSFIQMLRYSTDRYTGVITLYHDRNFYPCDKFMIAPNALRVRDSRGIEANLLQNYSYECLATRELSNALLPSGFRSYQTRILFGIMTEDGFWLRDPRSAQDVILEIRARCEDGPSTVSVKEQASWKQEYHGTINSSNSGTIFNLILPLEKYFNSGDRANYSSYEIDKIRERCYAEYLRLYFGEDG